MPAGSVLFDKLGTPLYEFGVHHKNSVKWSSQHRFMSICGFGNLNGEIDIWDTIEMKKVGQCKVKNQFNFLLINY